MNNNDNHANNSDSTPAEFPTYKGPRKLVWVDGRQIMQPDLEALSQGSSSSSLLQQSYFVGKTLDDIISETDQIQFSKLKTDEEKYDMIKGMITGVERKTNPPFKVSERYVDGEYRSLKTILQDLINKGKVWLNPKDGNLYEYGYALQEKMIKFPCRNCSKILYSEEDRTRHSYSHMIVQQR